MPSPTISRVVTVYRQWPLVARWLHKDSLFPAHVDWTFVNDCPEDAPPADIAAQIARRGARILTPKRNRGLAGARNFGWPDTRGEWLDFVDGDDLPMPLDLSDLDLDADLIFFPTAAFATEALFQEHLREEGRIPTRFFPAENDLFPFPKEMQLDVKMAAILWRRTTIERLEGFDGRFDMVEDNDILWRAALAGLRAKQVGFCKQSYNQMPNPDRRQLYRVASKLRVYQRIRATAAPQHHARLDTRLNDYLRTLFWHASAGLAENRANRGFLLKEGLKQILRALKP